MTHVTEHDKTHDIERNMTHVYNMTWHMLYKIS